MRRSSLSFVVLLVLGGCASGDAGRDNPIFTGSTTNNNTDMGDGDGDETSDGDMGDGDGEPGDGDGDPPGDGDGDPPGDGDGDPAPMCGNGVREGEEECDGNDLAGLDCTDFGHDNGTLVCADDCTLFTNSCSTCGDGQLAATEACDGGNFGGKTCTDLGYAGGSLQCAADCSQIIESGCMQAPTCGNGIIDGNEQCDGGNLNGQNCQSLGYDGGILGCTAGCQYNTDNCTIQECVPLFGACNIILQDCCDGLICYLSLCGPE